MLIEVSLVKPKNVPEILIKICLKSPDYDPRKKEHAGIILKLTFEEC